MNSIQTPSDTPDELFWPSCHRRRWVSHLQLGVRFSAAVFILLAISNCGLKSVRLPGEYGSGWTERTITNKELSKWQQQDRDLTLNRCYQILARLNVRAHYRIPEDIKEGKPLKVPNDFIEYKNWSPLPTYVDEANKLHKFVLIVKDIPFLGWYEKGVLVDDTYICVGKKWDWTRPGSYKVLTKDADHYSQSYPDASGNPAPMPWALRIYGHVWIHAGDVVGGYCSHGCINLPLDPAIQLFHWAKLGTTVVVLDSLAELKEVLAHSSGHHSGKSRI